MLTKAMKDYILNKTKRGVTKEKQRTYNDRLWKYATEEIKDLTLIAEKVPEELLTEIFNEKTMRKLFKTLFELPALKDSDSKEKRAEFEKKRERVIGLWHAFFSAGVLSNPFYGAQLVSKDVWRALSINLDRNLQAVLFATGYIGIR